MTEAQSRLTIVGSRLQSLIYSWAGLVAIVALWSSSPVAGVTLGVAGISLGASVFWRRFELGRTTIGTRSLFKNESFDIDQITADFGHRYLRIDLPDGQTRRIEVPVEIRPQVREWVERVRVYQSPSGC